MRLTCLTGWGRLRLPFLYLNEFHLRVQYPLYKPNVDPALTQGDGERLGSGVHHEGAVLRPAFCIQHLGGAERVDCVFHGVWIIADDVDVLKRDLTRYCTDASTHRPNDRAHGIDLWIAAEDGDLCALARLADDALDLDET